LKRFIFGLALVATAFAVAACDEVQPSGEQREARATEQLQNQAAVTVGMPAIVNFTEKRLLKMVYEMRDDPHLVTWSYYTDRSGGKHKVCPTTSIGYGFPYATQFSNPNKVVGSDVHALVAIAQPEPNGLFMPSASRGTWVICLAPDGKNLKPVYVEQDVMAYPFPMD
jgi:hypothetical protein